MKVFRILFIVILIAAVCAAFYFYFNQEVIITPIEEVVPTLEQQEQQPVIDPTVQGTLEEQLKAVEVNVSIQELETQLATPAHEPVQKIKVFSDQLSAPHSMVIDSFGNVLVVDNGSDALYGFRDTNGDFVADERIKIIGNLNNPTGIALHDRDVYIAEQDKIRVLRGMVADFSFLRNEVFIDLLPSSNGFLEKYIAITQDYLFITIGASCMDCEEVEGRGEVRRYSLADKSYEVVARNVFAPRDISVDAMGNVIFSDSSWSTKNNNSERIVLTQSQAEITLPTLTRPAGVVFYNGVMFPEFQNKYLVALSGAFQFTKPQGYRVISLTKEGVQTDVMTNEFLRGATVRGKPFDLVVGNRGEVYVSDVFSGKIYVLIKE